MLCGNFEIQVGLRVHVEEQWTAEQRDAGQLEWVEERNEFINY